MDRKIITFVFVFLAIAAGFFLLWPQYQILSAKKTEIAQKESTLKSYKDATKEYEALQQELDKYKEEISKIDIALPLDFDLPSLMDYLQKISLENGLNFSNFSLSSQSSGAGGSDAKESEKSDIKESHLSLSLSGSYDALKSILSVLEKSSRLIDVENISFSSPGGGKSSDKEKIKEGAMDPSITIKVYSY